MSTDALSTRTDDELEHSIHLLDPQTPPDHQSNNANVYTTKVIVRGSISTVLVVPLGLPCHGGTVSTTWSATGPSTWDAGDIPGAEVQFQVAPEGVTGDRTLVWSGDCYTPPNGSSIEQGVILGGSRLAGRA